MSEYDDKRKAYLAGGLTHDEYYLWLASKLHIGWSDNNYMGHNVEWWAQKYQQDECFNNVPLRNFDNLFFWFQNSARLAGYHNPSLADCTCIHKAVIKAKVLEYLSGIG